MNKYLYKIKDLEIPTHLKYWFARKSKINFDLSQILNGTSFDLTNTVNKKLHLINIFGNSNQDEIPTLENPIDIKNAGDNGSIVEKFSNSDNTQLQIYTIPCQQPMRAIGDVKDRFIKVNGVWYERHYITRKIFDGTESFGLESSLGYTRFNYTVSNIIVPATSARVIGNTASNYFRESITNDYGIIIQVQTRVAFYPDASITTVAEFKAWVSGKYNANKPLYLDYVMNNYTDLPCTQEQITALENLKKARTYKNVTHIYSEDEVSADLQIQYYKEKGE